MPNFGNWMRRRLAIGAPVLVCRYLMMGDAREFIVTKIFESSRGSIYKLDNLIIKFSREEIITPEDYRE